MGLTAYCFASPSLHFDAFWTEAESCHNRAARQLSSGACWLALAKTSAKDCPQFGCPRAYINGSNTSLLPWLRCLDDSWCQASHWLRGLRSKTPECPIWTSGIAREVNTSWVSSDCSVPLTVMVYHGMMPQLLHKIDSYPEEFIASAGFPLHASVQLLKEDQLQNDLICVSNFTKAMKITSQVSGVVKPATGSRDSGVGTQIHRGHFEVLLCEENASDDYCRCNSICSHLVPLFAVWFPRLNLRRCNLKDYRIPRPDVTCICMKGLDNKAWPDQISCQILRPFLCCPGRKHGTNSGGMWAGPQRDRTKTEYEYTVYKNRQNQETEWKRNEQTEGVKWTEPEHGPFS